LKKFLIIQTASIGDVILATPILEKLHHYFPEAKIDFLLKKGNESLFKAHPFLNKVITWDKSKKKYLNYIDVINFVRNRKYDYVINIQRFASSGFLTVLSGAKKTIGFNKNPFSLFFSKSVKHTIKNKNETPHEVDRNLKLIESLTDDKKFPVKLYPSKKDFAKTSQYKTFQYICIAPASLWFTKQYPVEKWIEFVREVSAEMRIYFLGSASDSDVCNRIIEQSGRENCLNLSGKLSFLETAALMKDARMNFVNDSAAQHLASAMNVPISTIYCSTVPAFGFGPLSDDSAVIETNEKLDCRPCGLHGLNACPKKHFKCATTIRTEQLLFRV
jgi:heptosyltransferase-2